MERWVSGRRSSLLLCLVLCVGWWACVSGAALAQTGNPGERITDFDSWLDVRPDGTIQVVETITVQALGKKIRRGIYRDFPTDYTTPSGVRHKVGFTLLSVQRDGRPEPHHTTRQDNGVRIYIGKSDVFLKPGTYTYTIVYQTDRQIGFFDDYDELYWNVTGNGWEFAIDRASATLNLPRQAIVRQHSVYTGPQGSTASDAEVEVLSGHEIRFRTTRPLGPREGLTFASAWQKGVIHEPDLQDEALFFFRSNRLLVFAAGGLLLLVGYYVVVWMRVGRDPEPEAIIPRFEPPRGYSPAAARFIMRMGFDDKSFAAALVNMAVKGFLEIENDGGSFTVRRKEEGDEKKLSRGERKVAGKLFDGSSFLELKQRNHRRIKAAISALKKSLQTDFETLHFKRNSIYLLPGLALTVLVIVLVIVSSRQKEVALFMSVWLTGWTVGCYALLSRVVTLWKIAASEGSGFSEKGAAIFLTLFSLPFIGGWIAGFSLFVTGASFIGVGALLLVLGINILFYHLLKAPTIEGRRVMDKLEGLKLYLSVAEKDRLNLLNPPEKTPELFERLLPWAMALDVEQQWGEQFSGVLARAAEKGEYSPGWYRGHHHLTPATLASSLGTSMAGTISASSTAPGSSSGSGGGGSSGGGGGGGGGGGW
ncbi:MAG: DUF2207 domain-containing protein [Desulfobulbaceae bacterium]